MPGAAGLHDAAPGSPRAQPPDVRAVSQGSQALTPGPAGGDHRKDRHPDVKRRQQTARRVPALAQHLGRADFHHRRVRHALRRHPVVHIHRLPVHHRRRAVYVHGGQDAVLHPPQAAQNRGGSHQHPQRGHQRHARHQVLRLGEVLQGTRSGDQEQRGQAHLGISEGRRPLRRCALLNTGVHRGVLARVLLTRGQHAHGIHRVHRPRTVQHAPLPTHPRPVLAHQLAQRAERRAASRGLFAPG